MDLLTALLAAATFPLACLGFVLWMARFEDGLAAAVRRTERDPDPPPVLAMPVREPAAHGPDGPVARADLDGAARAPATARSPRAS